MNMIGNVYEKYRQQEVLTAGSVDLVVMLYDGCVKQLKLARIFIQEKRYEEANNSFKKAQDIISELIKSLDLSFPIAKNLLNLYDFMIQELIRINIKKDVEALDPLLEILDSLRSAWAEVKKQQRPLLGFSED